MTKINGNTKALMASALRECMESTPIDKISVKSLTENCGLNRQTFYYHFKDIYDLVKWMYLRDIHAALEKAKKRETWTEALHVLLTAIEKDSACHVAIYESANYYPHMRDEIIAALRENIMPVFEPRFDEAGYDEGFREFLIRMYALTIFEFIERYARNNSYTNIDSFVDYWLRALDNMHRGALSREAERLNA